MSMSVCLSVYLLAQLVIYLRILNVFNLFNYGQLLVHSRALLPSQIACVICFIKMLVTDKD